MLAEIPKGEQCTYRLEQRFRYTYATPVRALRHRLLVVPRSMHGDQCRIDWGLTISGSPAQVSVSSDEFDNHVIDVRAARVSGCIEFDVWAVVVRGGSEADPNRSSVSETDGQYLEPTLLTQADGFLRGIADQLSATSIDDLDFAEKACAWTHRAMRYQFDVTSVHTTAADALAGGLGVCQDFSHIMLALCRAGGIPARYVSGHLLGEGGSHAWVEALITDRIGSRTAVAFDPTHDRPAGNNYLTVAVGRDYTDVAPTSGWFEGNCPGLLSTTKRLVPVTLGELTINPPRRHAGSC